jgi:hypothetical protein
MIEMIQQSKDVFAGLEQVISDFEAKQNARRNDIETQTTKELSDLVTKTDTTEDILNENKAMQLKLDKLTKENERLLKLEQKYNAFIKA